MLVPTNYLLSFVTIALLTVVPSSCAGKVASEDGTITIIAPKAGYVIAPINIATYNKGDPAGDMDFRLQGDANLNGKVNLTLTRNKDKKKKSIQIAADIPVTNGEAEAPITVPIWKLKSGDYTLKAIFYSDTGKPVEATRKVKVNLPKSAKNGQKAAKKPVIDADEVQTTGQETEIVKTTTTATSKTPQRRIKRMVEKRRLNVRDHY